LPKPLKMTMGLDVTDARTRGAAVMSSRSDASASMTSEEDNDARIGRARSVTRPRVDDGDAEDNLGTSRVVARFARARGPANASRGARDIENLRLFRSNAQDGAWDSRARRGVGLRGRRLTMLF